jgi:hypothetical protein
MSLVYNWKKHLLILVTANNQLYFDRLYGNVKVVIMNSKTGYMCCCRLFWYLKIVVTVLYIFRSKTNLKNHSRPFVYFCATQYFQYNQCLSVNCAVRAGKLKVNFRNITSLLIHVTNLILVNIAASLTKLLVH